MCPRDSGLIVPKISRPAERCSAAVIRASDLGVVATLLLVLVTLARLLSAVARAQAQSEPGITGYVLAADGAPVAGGTVFGQLGMISTAASIDSTGRFRVVPMRSGLYQLVVSVPGLAPYRVIVAVPASRSVRLPVIRLNPGAYFRVRLVAPGGEPITAPRLRRRLFDASGAQIFAALRDPISGPTDPDGAITIGPLPRGIMTAAVDMPGFAQTRLPDVNVGDATSIMDGGTVTIQQPGAVLHVDVSDGAGAAVPNQYVRLADTRPRSPLIFAPARTNQQGRATFDQLAAGRYRVSSTAQDRCANVFLTASRVVPISSNGTTETPLVIGGRARFRITSPLGPATAALVSASPMDPRPPPPFPFRATSFGCRGAADANGRVTLTNFPPGPAHVDVHMVNSTYIRQIEVPLDGREVAIAIPEGLLPVRVVNDKNEPVAGAIITWTGNGGRVEATATATGDALLEGVGTAAGTLTVSAGGYQRAETSLDEPPGVLHIVALTPAARPTNVRSRVMTTTREPVQNAVVALTSTEPSAAPRVAVTDSNGVVTFADVPPGSLQLIASAGGFVTSAMRIANGATAAVLFTLSRGYRVIVAVQLPATAGPQLVRVINDANGSMDDMLDIDSDRSLAPPGRLSIGPLGPGLYMIELQGGGRRTRERVRIVDGDVYATIR